MSEKGVVKGFKVFNSDWTCSPKGNKKQYTCPGKFEEDLIPSVCDRGIETVAVCMIIGGWLLLAGAMESDGPLSVLWRYMAAGAGMCLVGGIICWAMERMGENGLYL